jgi:hypothetical protein
VHQIDQTSPAPADRLAQPAAPTEATADPAAADLPPPAAAAPAAAAPTTAPPPAASRRAGALRRWRARLVVLLMLAAAVAGGLRLAQSRTVAAAQLDIGTVTLTADPIAVQTDQLGLVRGVRVRAHQQVRAGQELGRMIVTTTTGAGRVVRNMVLLRAPVTGIISDDPAPVGSALQPGTAFVQMYQPSRLTLVANVALRDLPRLAPGMRATLRGDALPGPIEAVVGQAVPRVGGNSAGVEPDHLAVQLRPEDARLVAELLPGLQFTGTVDTASVPPGERKSVYIGP